MAKKDGYTAMDEPLPKRVGGGPKSSGSVKAFKKGGKKSAAKKSGGKKATKKR